MYYGSAKTKTIMIRHECGKPKTWTKPITRPTDTKSKQYQGKRSKAGAPSDHTALAHPAASCWYPLLACTGRRVVEGAGHRPLLLSRWQWGWHWYGIVIIPIVQVLIAHLIQWFIRVVLIVSWRVICMCGLCSILCLLLAFSTLELRFFK